MALKNLGGKFAKGCSLSLHKRENDDKKVFDLKQKRYVSAVVLEHVIEKSLIKDYKSAKSYQICQSCVEHIQGILTPGADTQPRKRIKSGDEEGFEVVSLQGSAKYGNLDDAIELVCTSIANGALSECQLQKICQTIGAKVSKDLEPLPSTNKENRLDDIYADSYQQLWEVMPGNSVKYFMSGVAAKGEESNRFRKMMKCKEIMQSLVNPRFISNVSLGESLLLLNLTHSKYAVDLLSRIIPTGSYALLRNTIGTLDRQSRQLPQNDVIIAFDNNQIVLKTWQIKFHGKQPVSVVTTMAYFDFGSLSKLQYTTQIPTTIEPTRENQATLIKLYSDFNKSAAETHRLYRRKYIEDILSVLTKDCKLVNGKVEDSVTTENFENKSFTQAFEYSRAKGKKRTTDVVDLDCINENPNSYASVARVLDNILEYVDKSGRNYILITMDGGPFTLAMKLLRETLLCGICNVTVNQSDIKAHEKDHDVADIKWSRKYRKLIIRPGNGHTEITAIRAITSFFWKPFLRSVAHIMGYNTPNGLEFARKASSHHKSYNLLMVVFTAYSYELIYPYVHQCLLKKEIPTFDKFCEWQHKIAEKNLTYRMASDFVFDTLHSLQLFRSAVRNCNDEVAIEARNKLTSIFYISNNYRYQEILCYDTLYLLTVPKDVRSAIFYESSRRPASENAEGFDYLLEAQNRLYKSFLPTDTCPEFKNWLLVSRTAPDLVKLREKAASRLDMQFQSGDRPIWQYRREIHEARKLIRSLEIFNQTDYAFVTVDDTKTNLDATALDFAKNAVINQASYFDAFSRNERVFLPNLMISEALLDPLQINDHDLKALLMTKLAALREPFHTYFKKNMKSRTTRDQMVEFFHAVNNQLDAQMEADYAEESTAMWCVDEFEDDE